MILVWQYKKYICTLKEFPKIQVKTDRIKKQTIQQYPKTLTLHIVKFRKPLSNLEIKLN